MEDPLQEPGDATLDWTAAAQRRVIARRGSPRNAARPRPCVRTIDRAAFRTKLGPARENFARWLLERSILTEPMGDAHRAIARAMQRDRAAGAHDGPLDPEQEALAFYWWCTHWHIPDDPHRELSASWLAAEGPAFALRAFLRARALYAEIYPGSLEPPLGAHLGDKHVLFARQLRVALASCSEADWTETHDVAAQAAAGPLDPRTLAVLAFAFPEDRSLGAQASDGVRQHARLDPCTPWLVAAGIDPSHANALLQGEYPGYADAFACSALDVHGVAVLPGLLAAFAAAYDHRPPMGIAAALSSVVHPAVARAFAERRSRWRKPLGIDAEYLERYPGLLAGGAA